MTDKQLEDIVVFPGVQPSVHLHTKSFERAVKMTRGIKDGKQLGEPS
jgi:hypothetical protein